MSEKQAAREETATPKRRGFGWRALRGLGREAKALGKGIARWIMFSSLALLAGFFLLPRPAPIRPNTTLYISIDRPLAEASPLDAMPFLQFVLNPPKLSASMIERELHIAARDPNIAAIAVSLDGLSGTGAGPANRIGDALEAARAQGKTVTVFSTNFDNASWLIAAHADEILTSPMGRFDVGGVKAGTLYFGDALKRLRVEVVVGQAGRFKSAIEPYTSGAMSANARAALSAALERQHGALVARLGARAGKPTETIAAGLDRSASDGDDAQIAARLGLVDRLVDAPAFLDRAFGKPGDAMAAPFIALSHYTTRSRRDACKDDWKRAGLEGRPARSAIGVVTIEGAIMTGYTTADHAGSASVIAQIEGFARESRNRALLVRIDSPGGDAVASEHIRATLERYRALGRPVFVSMSSTAASGGYWIATASDRIYAEDTTITGSIGVFSLRASAAAALAEHGVRWDGLTIGKTSPFGGVTEPITAAEAAAMQRDVDRIYRRFIALVANARGLDAAKYEDWAEGRIFHASDARAIGLVDEIGGAGAALEALAEAASLPMSCSAPARPVSSTGSVISSFAPMSVLAELAAAVADMIASRHAAMIPASLREAAAIAGIRGTQAICFDCVIAP
jgi:protease-4